MRREKAAVGAVYNSMLPVHIAAYPDIPGDLTDIGVVKMGQKDVYVTDDRIYFINPENPIAKEAEKNSDVIDSISMLIEYLASNVEINDEDEVIYRDGDVRISQKHGVIGAYINGQLHAVASDYGVDLVNHSGDDMILFLVAKASTPFVAVSPFLVPWVKRSTVEQVVRRGIGVGILYIGKGITPTFDDMRAALSRMFADKLLSLFE